MKSISCVGVCLALLGGQPLGAFAQNTPEVQSSPDTQSHPNISSGVILQSVPTDSTASIWPATSGVHLYRTANSNQPSWAKFASGSGNLAFLAVGTLLPLLTEGKDGQQHSWRTADSLITSTVIATGLKIITHERRPDDSDYHSFPSGHVTAAFAVAAMQAHYHPRQALLWYGGAAVIGASRVELHKHYWHDVVAGAALGYFTSQLELKQKHGFVLRPFIHSDGGKEGMSSLAFSHDF